MVIGHEKLDIYRLSIDYVAWCVLDPDPDGNFGSNT